MDCVDPDCCEQLSCGSDPLCHGSADPLALLQQGPPPASAPPTNTHAHSFYRRIRFLLGKAATHSLPGDVPFDTRCVCRRALSVCPCMPNTFSVAFVFTRPLSLSRPPVSRVSKHKARGPRIRPTTSFYAARDGLKRHTMTFSCRNVREISCAFILKVSNKLDLCYNIRDIFL